MTAGELALKIVPDPEPVLMILRREGADLRQEVPLVVTPNDPGTSAGARRIVRPRWTQEMMHAYWVAFVARHQTWEKRLTDVMRAHLRSVRDGVIERLYRYAPQVRGLYAGWSRSKVRLHVESKAEEGPAGKININQAEEAAQLKATFAPYLQAMMADYGAVTLQDLGLGTAWNMHDKRVLKLLGQRMDAFSKQVSGTTFDAIKQILRDDFAEGLPAAATADKLRQMFDSWERWRAPLIARTETTAGMNLAQLLAVEQAGLEQMMLKHWLCAGDEATRPTHAAAHVKYADKGIEIGQMFKVGADEMMCPGQGKLAEENVNCRCCLRLSIRELPGQIEIVEQPAAGVAVQGGPVGGSAGAAEAAAARKPKARPKKPKEPKNRAAKPLAVPGKMSKRARLEMMEQQRDGYYAGANPDIVGQKIVVQGRLVSRILALPEEKQELFKRLIDFDSTNHDCLETNRETSFRGKLYAAVRNLVHNWAETSGDNNALAVALQLAAQDEFGLEASLWYWDTAIEKARREWGPVHDSLRLFLRIMYEDTQDFLKEKGIKELYLWRGFSTATPIEGIEYNPEIAQAVRIDLQPMSSFSLEPRTAFKFSRRYENGVMIYVRVPAERCVGSYRSGFGCMNEDEVVVLGRPRGVKEDMAAAVSYHELPGHYMEVVTVMYDELAKGLK